MQDYVAQFQKEIELISASKASLQQELAVL
jgi:hypothetical protein